MTKDFHVVSCEVSEGLVVGSFDIFESCYVDFLFPCAESCNVDSHIFLVARSDRLLQSSSLKVHGGTGICHFLSRLNYNSSSSRWLVSACF
jgi:hypothetical protein